MLQNKGPWVQSYNFDRIAVGGAVYWSGGKVYNLEEIHNHNQAHVIRSTLMFTLMTLIGHNY